MKRFLLICACIFFLPAFSFAADLGTCVDASVNAPVGMYYTSESGQVISGDEILVLCTAHTDGVLSVTLSGTTAKDALMKRLAGWYQWQIVSFPGDTAPDDNSDLEITEKMTDTIGLSLLGTNGTAFIDATTAKETVYHNAFLGVPTYRMATLARPWTISSAAMGASSTVYLLFRRVP